MLCNNRIEFNGSLLQFKHKVSSVLNYYIFDPPTGGIQRAVMVKIHKRQQKLSNQYVQPQLTVISTHITKA